MVNSPGKEQYIDAILKLDEKAQAVLMERMLKFLPAEEEPKPKQPRKFTVDLQEAMSVQLREKEKDCIHLGEQINKFEQENAQIVSKLAKKNAKYKALKKENFQLKNDFAELQRNSSSIALMQDRLQSEQETQAELDSLKQELKAARQKLANAEKLEESLQSELRDSEKRVHEAEEVVEQQKQKIDELLLSKHKLKKGVEQLSQVESRAVVLEREKADMEAAYQDFYSEMQEKIETEKKLSEELVVKESENERLQKQLQSSEEKERFWKQKANEAREELEERHQKTSGSESPDNAHTGSRGDFMSEAKEATYQSEINRLRQRIQDVSAGTEERIQVETLELEKQLEAAKAEIEKLREENALEIRMREETKKVNEDMQAELESNADEKATLNESMKEFQRIKKDRDTLLELAKRAQDTMEETTNLKGKLERMKTQNSELDSHAHKLESERDDLNAKLKALKAENLELERRLARSDEKMVFLKEEHEKLGDITRKNTDHAPDSVRNFLVPSCP